jgi:molybdate transport system ATP-binding protein
MSEPRAPQSVEIVTPSSRPAPAERSESDGPRLQVSLRRRVPSEGHEFSLDVEFQAAPGITILFGPSGAGKTTLLDCVAGLTTPDSGRIAIGDRALFDAAQRTDLPVAKRRVGYVFQSLALFPHLTVEQNVQYGLSHLSQEKRAAEASAILQAFRISRLASRYDPTVLLLDEPLAALDAATKGKIIDDLREWNQAHRIPILYVTHSREEVFALGDRVVVLDAGRIVAQGTPHEVISAPLQETVAQLVGFENIFDAAVESVHPERGTMSCRIAGDTGPVVLETPLVRGGVGSALRVGIRAGDILLATAPPVGLSARNVIPGRIASLEQRDVIVTARVKCRVEMEVHLTLAARDSLQLEPGREVWLVIKTHSCHLMQR